MIRASPGGPAPHLLGFFPRRGTWDGGDLFRPDESPVLCVTEPVRDMLVALGVVGVVFERMSEVATWIWDE